MGKKENVKMKVVLFGKEYEVTQKELAVLYKGVGIKRAAEEARDKFNELIEKIRYERLKNDPNKLLEFIINEIYTYGSLDYGADSELAISLIKYLPEEQLEILEKKVGVGSYKEAIDNARNNNSNNENDKSEEKVEQNVYQPDSEESETLPIKLFDKKYDVTQRQLTELYEALGIRFPDIEAEERFEEVREREYKKKMLKNPEELYIYIENLMYGTAMIDYDSRCNKEAVALIRFLPEEYLEKLEKKVSGEYKEAIDKTREKRTGKKLKKHSCTKKDDEGIEHE